MDIPTSNGTGEKRIHVRKSALCKLYMGETTKLSSDRLQRVKQRAPCKRDFQTNNDAQKTIVNTNLEDEIDEESWDSFELWRSGDRGEESTSDESTFESDEMSDFEFMENYHIFGE